MAGPEFEGALVEAPEGKPATAVEAHTRLKKADAKKQPVNLMDLIRLLGLKRIAQEQKLSPEVLGDPQKKIEQLTAKLQSPRDQDKEAARREIQSIIGAADLLGAAENEIDKLVANPNAANQRALGITELAHKFSPGKFDSPVVLAARALEGDLLTHFRDPNVGKMLRGERVTLSVIETKAIEDRNSELYARLAELTGKRLNIPDNHAGLAAARARFEVLKTRVRIQQERGREKGAFTPAVQHELKEFTDTAPDRKLQIRKKRAGHQKIEDEESLDKFKKMVAKDFDPSDPEVNKKTINELLEAVQTTSSWRSGIAVIVGNKDRVAMEEQIDGMLILVEESYLDALAEKMKEGLKLAKDDPFNGKVVDWLRTSMNDRRGQGRVAGKGSFQPGVLKWDDLKKDVQAMRINAEKMYLAESSRGRNRGGPPIMTPEMAAAGITPEMYVNERDRVETLKAMEKFLDDQGLQGFSVDELIDKNPDTKDRINLALKQALADPSRGLSRPEQEREYERVQVQLERIRRSIEMQRGGENLAFAHLEKELEEGNIQQYLFDLKAYFERVGPRESSSDFELAFIIRRAKEVLSRPDVMGGDLGQNWNVWEGQLYNRGNFCEIDEKEYMGRAPKLLNQDTLFQQRMEQQWMNGVMVNVKTWNEAERVWQDQGEKKILSTLAYYQMLRRDVYADRTLSSAVDKTDSMHKEIMLCVLYGEGTRVLDGTTTVVDRGGNIICDLNDKTTFNFFDRDGSTKGDVVKDRSLDRLLGDSLHISRWAESTWYYSLEWRKNNLDFNLDRYRRINKNILKYLSLEAYDGHYGPAEAAMRQLFKAGALLPDLFTYKLGDVGKSAVADLLIGGGISVDQAEWVAKMMTDVMLQKADVVGAKFNVGMKSVDDVRQLGTEVNTLQEAWEIFRARESIKKNGRDLTDIPDIEAVFARPANQRTEKEDFFLKQAQNFHRSIRENQTLVDWRMLNGQADIIVTDPTGKTPPRNLGRLNENAIKILNDRLMLQQDLSGAKRPPEDADWRWFFQNFEYSAVLDFAGTKKQSDVMDYMGYFNDAKEVYGLMQAYGMGTADWKTFEALCLTLQKYQPAKQEVERWAFEALSLENKLRTNPWEAYEIPDADENYVTKYETWKDERGKVWYLLDHQGFRVPKMKTVKHDLLGRSYMKKERDLENYSRADIELRAKKLFALRILSKDGREKVLRDSLGPKWQRLLMRALWFDEPLFAFFELFEETKKYAKEVGAEILAVNSK